MPPPPSTNTDTITSPTYTTTRPKQHLLHNGTKRTLQKPKTSTYSLNPSALPASTVLRSTLQISLSSNSKADSNSGAGPGSAETVSARTTSEVDIVGSAGQPFLDPARWEETRRVGEMVIRRDGDAQGDRGEEGGSTRKGRKEFEEEERRRREREAEFGGMAVRGRMRGR